MAYSRVSAKKTTSWTKTTVLLQEGYWYDRQWTAFFILRLISPATSWPKVRSLRRKQPHEQKLRYSYKKAIHTIDNKGHSFSLYWSHQQLYDPQSGLCEENNLMIKKNTVLLQKGYSYDRQFTAFFILRLISPATSWPTVRSLQSKQPMNKTTVLLQEGYSHERQ
jgi:hypothetical protein